MCKGELELEIEEEHEKEIVKGTINCNRCNEFFPISDGIPNMLPPELRKVVNDL